MFSDIPIWSYMYNEQNWIVFTPQLITQQGLNTKTTGIHEYGSPPKKMCLFWLVSIHTQMSTHMWFFLSCASIITTANECKWTIPFHFWDIHQGIKSGSINLQSNLLLEFPPRSIYLETSYRFFLEIRFNVFFSQSIIIEFIVATYMSLHSLYFTILHLWLDRLKPLGHLQKMPEVYYRPMQYLKYGWHVLPKRQSIMQFMVLKKHTKNSSVFQHVYFMENRQGSSGCIPLSYFDMSMYLPYPLVIGICKLKSIQCQS
jgi:hypothetical protein